MSTYDLQPILPWTAPLEEDQRFRRILTTALASALVISGIVPLLPLPQVDPPWEAALPPRVARIIGERFVAPGPGAVAPASVRKPAPQAPAEPPSEAQPTPRPEPEPEVTASPTPERKQPRIAKPQDKTHARAAARRRAANAGILALSDSLAELRNSAADIGVASPGLRATDSAPAGAGDKPSVLSAGLTEGSGGIGGEGVAHREVLTPLAIPGGNATGGGAGAAGARLGREAERGSAGAAGARGDRGARLARSQEEIQEILERHKRAMYTLYNRALRVDPRLEGKVVVSLTIAPSGQVTECLIAYSELNAEALERKLVLLIKRIDFGAKPGVPSVTTKVPIEFFPT